MQLLPNYSDAKLKLEQNTPLPTFLPILRPENVKSSSRTEMTKQDK